MSGNLILVAAGGGAGAVLRYLLSQALSRPGVGWPWATFLANIAGGLLIGLLAGWLAFRAGAEGERVRLLLGVGVLGGFTTFSAFSWDALQLLQRGQTASAGIYILGSVVLSLAAVMAGFQLGRA